MIGNWKISGAAIAMGLTLGGCAASLSPDPAFLDVASLVEERTGKTIAWDVGSADDLAVRHRLKGMLSRPLTPASAIQIALLNNRSLQAAYANIGIAQADLVQAGLLSNPVFDGAIAYPYEPEVAAPTITLGIIFNFIELFWKPLKKAVARSALEQVKTQVAGLVIDHAAKTHLAFIDHEAARQEAALFRQVVRSARATVVAAKAIREAGNSTSLDFEQQQSVLTQAKLDLAIAEVAAAAARERLNVLMGLKGNDTEWTAPAKLPDIPHRELSIASVERRAISKSLNLAELQQKIITLGYKYKLTSKKALIPDIGVGAEWERVGHEKEIGPVIDITLPIFDRGEAKRARAIMEIRQAQDEYWAMGIEIRSAARLARAALITTRKTATYYQRALLPQRQRVLSHTQRQYNAMQESVFQLIIAKREQIVAGQQYIGALRAYWRARVIFQQLMSGRLPGDSGGGAMVVAASAGGGGAAGGH